MTDLPPAPPEPEPLPPAASADAPTPQQAQELLEKALFQVRRVIAGQDLMLERVLICLLTGGHLIVVPYWVSRSPVEFTRASGNAFHSLRACATSGSTPWSGSGVSGSS